MTLGASIARMLKTGDVLGLSGDLGAGKSTLARMIITPALASKDIDAGDIPSPSFTLVQHYPFPATDDGGRAIWHIDLWRIETAAEITELGLEEAFARHICLIEWPERCDAILPDASLMIRIDPATTLDRRTLRFVAGKHYCEDWQARLSSLSV